MTDKMVLQICDEYEDISCIDSEACGLKYFLDDCRNRIAIAGNHGIVMLSENQIYALISELPDIYDIYIHKRTKK